MKTITLVLVSCTVVITGCAGSYGTVGKNQGWLEVRGDGKGWEKFASRDADLIDVAKADPKVKPPSYQLKESKVAAAIEKLKLKIQGGNDNG